jgi:hypothetical protein
MMIKPNFFLIGAPKCGTTALSEYLRQHPSIEFSNPKEPAFFCTDYRYPDALTYRDEQDYLERCFGHCQDKNLLAIGEGSTTYFYSVTAIPNILEFQPDAKIIVMLRNPLDMVPALHAQKLLALEEDVKDFQEAWFLAEKRQRTGQVSQYCVDPKLLDYPRLGMLGENLQRIFSQIPAEQRMVILFEDFLADTRKVYTEVLEFLGVPDDGRSEFAIFNQRREIKHPFLYRFGFKPPAALLRLVGVVKGIFGIKSLGVLAGLQNLASQPVKTKTLTPDMRELLLAEFSTDIRLVPDLTYCF